MIPREEVEFTLAMAEIGIRAEAPAEVGRIVSGLLGVPGCAGGDPWAVGGSRGKRRGTLSGCGWTPIPPATGCAILTRHPRRALYESRTQHEAERSRGLLDGVSTDRQNSAAVLGRVP